MYRIHFQVRTGKWVIQFLVWGLFWVTVKDDAGQVRFEDFDAAVDYTTVRGLDQMYRLRKTKDIPRLFDWEQPQYRIARGAR